MWKRFKYSGRERVAFIPQEGPSYQVLDAGKVVTGFRAFKPEGMKDVEFATNHFSMVDAEDLKTYTELEAAK